MVGRAYAVIGANYGDEGKGLITDYLCSKLDRPIVVRYNGGVQAGHTVVTPEGKRFVFGHIGSGSFLGIPTYYSGHFIHAPHIHHMRQSYCKLDTQLIAHPDGLVSTPYDILINQSLERSRKKKHGSCGVGVFETVVRSKCPRYAITIKELPDIRDKLTAIRDEYIKHRCLSLNMQPPALTRDSNVFENFIEDCQKYYNSLLVRGYDYLKTHNSVVFEGAQGLRLDQDLGKADFPHVTPSYTGLPNIVKICETADIKELNTIYVSRPYLTRHGNGPLLWETDPARIFLGAVSTSTLEDRTNIANEWQGHLRYARLSKPALNRVIHADINRVQSTPVTVIPSVAITCVDQVPDEFRGELFRGLATLDFPVSHTSYGPTRSDVKEV